MKDKEKIVDCALTLNMSNYTTITSMQKFHSSIAVTSKGETLLNSVALTVKIKSGVLYWW